MSDFNLDQFLFSRFIKNNENGSYSFDSDEFSAFAGEPIDLETAQRGEQEILGRFLACQINLM